MRAFYKKMTKNTRFFAAKPSQTYHFASIRKSNSPTELNGGGGIRTPVPRCFKISFYMHSRFFKFRLTARQTTGLRFGYFGKISPCRPKKPAQPACFVTPLPNSQAKSDRTGRLIKQPFATGSCQLKVVAGGLARPTGVLGMRLVYPPSGRSRSPPYSLFKIPPFLHNKPPFSH